MRAIIDYTDTAKEFCTFSDTNLRIFIYDGKRIVDVMPFNSHNLAYVKEKEMPVVWRMDTSSCEKLPEEFLFLGRLRIK